ncbi:MAG: Sporulation initiation phosphotransferase F [Pelotomaculum sp. PtaU1.Bin035]|nr:MAG: Sporulation initiation phosphotransferase F [Pelotomaculum sp. PtaU1.Bin035]
MSDYLLVVDDNAGVRCLLFEILSHEGYNVEMAANGLEALRKVSIRVPSLIILDAKMPGMSGLETLEELKKLAPNVPVIIITAYTELDAVIEAQKCGMVMYHLRKPFDIDDIRNLVRSIMAKETNDDQKPKAN